MKMKKKYDLVLINNSNWLEFKYPLPKTLLTSDVLIESINCLKSDVLLNITTEQNILIIFKTEVNIFF